MSQTSEENPLIAAAKQAGLRPASVGLFPVLDNPQAVIDLAISQLPIKSPNQVVGLLMTYHNSLIKAIEEHEKLS